MTVSEMLYEKSKKLEKLTLTHDSIYLRHETNCCCTQNYVKNKQELFWMSFGYKLLQLVKMVVFFKQNCIIITSICCCCCCRCLYKCFKIASRIFKIKFLTSLKAVQVAVNSQT